MKGDEHMHAFSLHEQMDAFDASWNLLDMKMFKNSISTQLAIAVHTLLIGLLG